jgi:uncharacterized protein (TIGR03790 family)
VALAVALWQPRAAAQSAENVLVIANDASPASSQIADYYARKRAVPAAQVVRLRLPIKEEIDRTTFVRLIETPIAEWLTKHSAQDRILYIVLTKDVPLRISGSDGNAGTVASVDSELTLLYRKLIGRQVVVQGHLPNPYYAAQGFQPALRHFTHALADMYLVTRLDGYTVGDAIGLIDRAMAPAQSGKIVLDQKGSGVNRAGDQWLERAAEVLGAIGARQQVVLERTTALAERETGVIGYYSWGSNDPSFRTRHVNMAFVPGAVAATFVSTDARTFQTPPESWTIGDWSNRATFFAGSPQSLIGDLLREGVTGAAGHVAEPFLDATIRPQVLFPAYLSGFNLAESFYLAMPYVSWQTVVIGDPLCAPFRKSPVATTDIDAGIDPSTELPALFSSRRVEQLSESGGNPATITSLVKATGRLARGDRDGARAGFDEALRLDPKLTSAEKALALLDDQDRRYASAIEHYKRVVAQTPNDVLALNNLAFLIATRTSSVADALPLAERAATLAPRDVNILDTLAWVHYLNGNARRADALLQQARIADRLNADVWIHSSAVHLALGDAATAERALAEALRLDGSLSTRDDVVKLQTEIKRRHSF